VPSGQSTRAPCAVERDALSGRGSNLSLGVSTYQRIISHNYCIHDEQRNNSEQKKEGSTVFSVTVAGALISSVKA